MNTLFLYTGHDLDNFRANVPDYFIVFAPGSHQEARQVFIEKIGKEPELMGFEYVEGSSKEIAWQKAIDSGIMNEEVELEMAMALDGTLVLSEPDDTESSRKDL